MRVVKYCTKHNAVYLSYKNVDFILLLQTKLSIYLLMPVSGVFSPIAFSQLPSGYSLQNMDHLISNFIF